MQVLLWVSLQHLHTNLKPQTLVLLLLLQPLPQMGLRSLQEPAGARRSPSRPPGQQCSEFCSLWLLNLPAEDTFVSNVGHREAGSEGGGGESCTQVYLSNNSNKNIYGRQCDR